MIKRIGAHVSVSKGLSEGLKKAQEIGANCIQIFSSPPLSFNPPKFTDRECADFKTQAKELDILPVFIHAKYLINLGSEKDTLLKLSIQSLVTDLQFADKIGAGGVIVHTGSHKGSGFENVLPKVIAAVAEIMKQTPQTTKLYLEIASGGKGKIGSTFEELQKILITVKNPRVGICLDTAHLFAGGYALKSTKNINELSATIKNTVGWQPIACLHTNDSKGEFGSFRDRHENIGEGFIGKEPFRLLLKHADFGQLPFILETPGFNDKGPDKQNLDILKLLV